MKALFRFRWTALAIVGLIAVVLIRSLATGDTVERNGLTYAGPALADALETGYARPGVRVLAKFADDGVSCRAFLGSAVSGIACKERGGWHMRLVRDGVDLGDPAAVASIDRELRAAVERLEAQ
jgi:hypothetical protein